MVVIRARINKMLARIANREDPGQTASSEGLNCLFSPFYTWQLEYEICEHPLNVVNFENQECKTTHQSHWRSSHYAIYAHA